MESLRFRCWPHLLIVASVILLMKDSLIAQIPLADLSPIPITDQAPQNPADGKIDEDDGRDDLGRLEKGVAVESFSGIVPASLPLGERLVFEATVEWKGAQVLVGHLELASFQEDLETTILHARGKGERFGYLIDQQITSRLDRMTGQPIEYINVQRGSEYHTKKLLFENGSISYKKREHCRKSDCSHPKHNIAEVSWKGPIPWGTKDQHCDDKKCGNPTHESWVVKKVHQVDEPYVDLLTSIFVARTAKFPSDDETIIIPAINDDSRWFVEVKKLQTKEITVKEGTYEAIELSLSPLSSDGNEKKRFKGLFGIHGTLRVWIDSISRKPLLIQGTLPVSVLDLKARIELISTGDAEIVKLRRASTQKALLEKSAERPR